MSASMYWRPVYPPPEGEYVADHVRQKMGQRLWGDYSSSTQPHELTVSDIDYLHGLVDGGVEGAQELIDAIRKHGSIEIWIVR